MGRGLRQVGGVTVGATALPYSHKCLPGRSDALSGVAPASSMPWEGGDSPSLFPTKALTHPLTWLAATQVACKPTGTPRVRWKKRGVPSNLQRQVTLLCNPRETRALLRPQPGFPEVGSSFSLVLGRGWGSCLASVRGRLHPAQGAENVVFLFLTRL